MIVLISESFRRFSRIMSFPYTMLSIFTNDIFKKATFCINSYKFKTYVFQMLWNNSLYFLHEILLFCALNFPFNEKSYDTTVSDFFYLLVICQRSWLCFLYENHWTLKEKNFHVTSIRLIFWTIFAAVGL